MSLAVSTAKPLRSYVHRAAVRIFGLFSIRTAVTGSVRTFGFTESVFLPDEKTLENEQDPSMNTTSKHGQNLSFEKRFIFANISCFLCRVNSFFIELKRSFSRMCKSLYELKIEACQQRHYSF